MTTTTSFPVAEIDLESLNDAFESQPASAIVRWAVDTFGERICLTASMQDAVLIDVASRVAPGIEVVFIDTGYHFPETLQTVKLVRERYDLNLRVMRIPASDPPLWEADPENCCANAKVAQLDEALRGKLAWMSGLRRVEADTRSDAPIVGRDSRGLIKVNPLAAWSDLDVSGYIADHDVPVNPLVEQGYPSIGCMPCTRPVTDGEHPRAGRWAGLDKVECGIHL
jgi:phosphoadenosine phosphosulfate reductase